MDETYIKVAGQWKYLYRTVDKSGDTVEFLLHAKRYHAAALAYFERAIGLHDVPDKIAIQKSGTSTAAIVSNQTDSALTIMLRQSKYLNNIFEQDHRAINASSDQCSDSRVFAVPELTSLELKRCI